jgi:hypothetical protein
LPFWVEVCESDDCVAVADAVEDRVEGIFPA